MDCKNNSANKSRCNCTYGGCSHHGVCCECIAYHRARNELPACYFTQEQERTYDRSIGYFLKTHRE